MVTGHRFTLTGDYDMGRARAIARTILTDEENVTLMDSTPLVFMHIVSLLMLPFVGISAVAVTVCLVTYLVRVFALTAGFHRYFSHRAFKTSRVFQFVLAFLGGMSAQMGAIWWASHHRRHHVTSDTPEDPHSPRQHGFFYAHIGWLLCRKYAKADHDCVGDLLQYPELRLLDRFHAVPPLVLAFATYGLGAYLERAHPGLGTSGWQMLAWGFFLSTVLVYHVTFCVNSVTHMFGSRRFDTQDDSRNSLILALLTMGEGWHNNHHRYPISTRQGFYWWEIDVTYYILLLLEKVRVISDLRAPPKSIYEEALRSAEPVESTSSPEEAPVVALDASGSTS